MTLKEAYRVLRRFEDWFSGADGRTLEAAFPKREHREAIKLILAAQGLDKPIAVCRRCVHHSEETGYTCELLAQGECTKFDEVQP